MALPAGRYGVTKNQLLKIKKLPMNTIKLIEELTEKFNLLGSAAFKNSTSVVTQSSDLVESGAVKDIIGWGNKNLADVSKTEIGVAWNGASNVDRARLIIPCSGNTTYTLSINATITIDLMYVNHTPTVPAQSSGDIFDTTITITTSSNDAYIVVGFNKTAISMSDVEALKLQLEVGSTATAYEPYHASVEDSLEEKADNSVIGTVEDGATASQAYAVGEHFIKDGQFKEVTQPIASGGAINDSNTVDRPIADCLVKQATFSGTTSDMGAVVIYNSNDRVVLSAEALGYTASLYKRGDGYGCVIRTPQGEALITTAISGTYYYI